MHRRPMSERLSKRLRGSKSVPAPRRSSVTTADRGLIEAINYVKKNLKNNDPKQESPLSQRCIEILTKRLHELLGSTHYDIKEIKDELKNLGFLLESAGGIISAESHYKIDRTITSIKIKFQLLDSEIEKLVEDEKDQEGLLIAEIAEPSERGKQLAQQFVDHIKKREYKFALLLIPYIEKEADVIRSFENYHEKLFAFLERCHLDKADHKNLLSKLGNLFSLPDSAMLNYPDEITEIIGSHAMRTYRFFKAFIHVNDWEIDSIKKNNPDFNSLNVIDYYYTAYGTDSSKNAEEFIQNYSTVFQANECILKVFNTNYREHLENLTPLIAASWDLKDFDQTKNFGPQILTRFTNQFDLDIYLKEISERPDNHHQYSISLFCCTLFNFGYSAKEKREAAMALKNAEETGDFSQLAKHSGALNNGRLGKIYKDIEASSPSLRGA